MKKILMFVFASILISCSSDETNEIQSHQPKLIVKFDFNPNQARLNNLGQPSTIPSGNAAQSPDFNKMSAHYIEFAPTANTLLGDGEVVYQGQETTQGGENAINFNNAIKVAANETFLSIPLSEVANGSYEWVRVSLSYQNYDIDVLHQGVDYVGTLASFVGFNQYLSTITIDDNQVALNTNKLQGYWAFELGDLTFVGQAPEGATTVPNPLFNTSPINAGSCVVTGEFTTPFTITGNETNDIVVTLSLSTNNSFEWEDTNADGKYEPNAGEQVVDMGFRGLVPSVN